MEKETRRDQCADLKVTIARRLLYKMPLKDQKELVRRVLAKPIHATQNFKYTDEKIGSWEMPANIPIPYKQQKALLTELIDKGVTPYVFTSAPRVYWEPVIERLGHIKPEDVTGSAAAAEILRKNDERVHADFLLGDVLAGEGDAKGMIAHFQNQGKQPVFITATQRTRVEVVEKVLEVGGFALIQRDEMTGWAQVENQNYGNVKQIHIQNVKSKDAIWSIYEESEGSNQ